MILKIIGLSLHAKLNWTWKYWQGTTMYFTNKRTSFLSISITVGQFMWPYSYIQSSFKLFFCKELFLCFVCHYWLSVRCLSFSQDLQFVDKKTTSDMLHTLQPQSYHILVDCEVDFTGCVLVTNSMIGATRCEKLIQI